MERHFQIRSLVQKALSRGRKDGLIALILDIVSFVTNKYPRILAEAIVLILKRSDRIIQADEIGYQTHRYTSEKSLKAGIKGGNPDSELLNHVGEWTAGPQFVRVIDDVRLIGPYGIVVTENGEVVLDCSCNSEDLLYHTFDKMINQYGLVETGRLLVKGFTGLGAHPRNSDQNCVISMLNPQSMFYFHWTIEHIPRLRSIDAIDGVEREEVEILIQHDAPDFVPESLQLLDYSNYSLWEGDVEEIGSLIVPDHQLRSRYHKFMISPPDLQWLRSKAIRAVESEQTYPEKRIYISRSDADEREVVNSEQLSEAIRPLGFEKFVLSELTIEQQVRLFRHAEVILAPHGGGLANMVYSESVKILELYADDLTQGRYFMILAEELSHEYYTMRCNSEGENMVAPIDEVVELLEEMVENP